MASAPTNHHPLWAWRFLNEPIASLPPARPSANSLTITGIPNIITHATYIIRNAAPPFACASAGNLHTFPSPIAEPTVAAIKPNFDANSAFFAMIILEIVII